MPLMVSHIFFKLCTGIYINAAVRYSVRASWMNLSQAPLSNVGMCELLRQVIVKVGGCEVSWSAVQHYVRKKHS